MEEINENVMSKFRKFSRPKLNIPMVNIQTDQRSPVVQIPISAIPIGNLNGPLGLMHFYPSKAGEFVNKRYKGFKDFTKNTAKSGLSFGEKVLIWLNGRIRQWSKNWFTHIFLFLVVLLYSLIGAILFVTVEGSHEESEKVDIHREFVLFANNVRNMAQDTKMVYNRELWIEKFKEMMAPYENQLLESFSHGVTPSEHKVWSFWNSLFYCGTIYTTIDQKDLNLWLCEPRLLILFDLTAEDTFANGRWVTPTRNTVMSRCLAAKYEKIASYFAAKAQDL